MASIYIHRKVDESTKNGSSSSTHHEGSSSSTTTTSTTSTHTNNTSSDKDPKDVLNELLQDIPNSTSFHAAVQKDNLSRRFTDRELFKICQLTNLTFLDLSGHCIQSLPPNISQLSSLQTLIMNKSDLATLPKNIELLEHSLIDLQFRLNSFKEWPSQLNKMNLQKLDMSFNRLNRIQISTTGIAGLFGFDRPQQLQSTLRELNLSYNYLTTFPQDLLKFSNLERLDLTKNDLETLPDISKLADSMKELSVENCNFTAFPVTICSLLNLRVLNVSGNKFEWFPQTQGLMSQLCQLRELYANGCGLHGWAQLFCQAKLEILHLSNNSIRGVPTEVRTLQMLQELILSKNYITHIPEHFSDFVNLVYLDLSDNNIEDVDPAFGNLKKLEILKLKSNRITELPPEMSELESLIELDLSENDLKDLFDFSKVKNLERLEATYNYLESFPKIGNCKKLKHLDLTMNRISGEIPDYFYELHSLTFCKLKHNSFESIDPKISQLTSLEILNLDNNEIISIPDSVMNLKSLKQFSIINNYQLNPSEQLKTYMQNKNITFEYAYEEPSKIKDSLFLSSAPPAGSRRLLKSLGVTHILTVAKDIPPRYKNDFKYMIIFADDTTEATLKPHFEEASKFIQEAISTGGACMVHCMAGVSRSSAIVISHIMLTEKKRLNIAYREVYEKRDIIKPNDKFYRELKLLDKELFQHAEPTPVKTKNRVEYFDANTDERIFKRPKDEKPSILHVPSNSGLVSYGNGEKSTFASLFNFSSLAGSESESGREPMMMMMFNNNNNNNNNNNSNGTSTSTSTMGASTRGANNNSTNAASSMTNGDSHSEE
ncbi:hypothetical protein FDP41_004933 [Naegleria fowleri]|uniref:Protein-serine/threonine phosphatase n=1 Tax=Naegleria fowleri TaxID=5763 RepID=A0A6A5BPX0_NAEFO|nr:uncharacterized protein FDP41_004933 [Naegleria fowleri]KAF0976258.1 hypothetical protein FDP41_004933 [Naegleria fowleri]